MCLDVRHWLTRLFTMEFSAISCQSCLAHDQVHNTWHNKIYGNGLGSRSLDLGLVMT